MIGTVWKTAALAVWRCLDPLYFACTRLQYVEPGAVNIFRVRVLTYRGPALRLHDGTAIASGDRLLKIHLHNARLLSAWCSTAEGGRAARDVLIRSRLLYRLTEQSLPGIARHICNQCNPTEIKAIIGITQINRGCQRLGFEVFPLPSRVYRLLKRVALLPIYLLSVDRPWRSFHKHEPKMLLMSRLELLTRYG
jgi:hypothetical protein